MNDVSDLPSGYGIFLLQTLFALGVVCLLAFILLRFGMKKLYGLRKGKLLHVTEHLPLDPKRSLYVINVAGKHILLGSGEQGIRLIKEFDEKDEENISKILVENESNQNKKNEKPDSP